MRRMRAAMAGGAMLLVALATIGAAAPGGSSEAVPFEEIDRGEISRFRYDSDFTGGEFLFTDIRSWAEFWISHTRGITPQPRLPEVRFPRENVIVVLLGNQTSGGGPSIGIQGITRVGRRKAIVNVAEDRTPGTLGVITNPYQIVRTPALPRSIQFLHKEPGRLCQDHDDCPPDFLCSRADPTCRSPVTGVCRAHPPGSFCPTVYIPFCGCDGITYSNVCFLELEGAIAAHVGECP